MDKKSFDLNFRETMHIGYLGVCLFVVAVLVQGKAYATADVQRDIGAEEIILSHPVGGKEAIAMLGSKLSTIAARNGMNAADLAALLRRDSRLRIDVRGDLFYIEALPKESLLQNNNNFVTNSVAPFPSAQTFALHSRPNSNRVIFLDFDGHSTVTTATGTAWGFFSAPPYDLDGSPNSYSPLELETIQRIWMRVSNDFAPFNVDVTTEEPTEQELTRTNAFDQNYGVRIVFTDDSIESQICDDPCGGAAYIGAFDKSIGHKGTQVAWVILRTYNGSGKTEAGAGSHEAGHTLGLHHDGQNVSGVEYYAGHYAGPLLWAPIMGNPYSADISQWSAGAYPLANNTENDLSIINSNGANYASDDYSVQFNGSNYGNVRQLGGSISGNFFVVSQSGNIGINSDSDDFKFYTSGGSVTISVGPSLLYSDGTNLDAEISIIDVSGNVLAVADDGYGLGATISASLAAGNYVVRVRGVGDLNPAPGYPAYGSLGYYQLSGSFLN